VEEKMKRESYQMNTNIFIIAGLTRKGRDVPFKGFEKILWLIHITFGIIYSQNEINNGKGKN
jgi:hypothetical protein